MDKLAQYAVRDKALERARLMGATPAEARRMAFMAQLKLLRSQG